MTCRSLDIHAARPDEWPAAFALALRHVPDDERPTRIANALTLLAEGEIDPAGIFVARSDTGLAGVQVCIPLRGASGLVWLPQLDPACPDRDIANRLVATALGWLRHGGAKLAQAMLPPSDLQYAGALIQCGFRHVTQLVYLRHDLEQVPPVPSAPALRLEPFAPANAAVFARTLERTYDDTLDCPELNGVRTTDEILDGHRGQGAWHPETWWLVHVDDGPGAHAPGSHAPGADAAGAAPAGVVLLSEFPEGYGWDLSYFGVVPEHRRRGLGRAMLVRTMHVVRDAYGLPLHLAVDRRNAPARRMYEGLGFHTTGVREVLLHLFSTPAARPA
ncbi:MAG: GNAT family N-acetyltransferase [Gemmataceae bacterium]|nr:GNAT family N-acetyltransferase [Gemmataceae bacterium]